MVMGVGVRSRFTGWREAGWKIRGRARSLVFPPHDYHSNHVVLFFYFPETLVGNSMTRVLDKPVTIFEYRSGRPMPDWFVERYDDELSAWGANFRKIGPIKSIVLREGAFSDLSPDPEHGAVLLGVKLIAEVSSRRDRVVVRPLGERDEALIAKHCEKMMRLGVRPRAVLVEPERPGIPFMPDHIKPN
jgi:hypothetical protein